MSKKVWSGDSKNWYSEEDEVSITSTIMSSTRTGYKFKQPGGEKVQETSIVIFYLARYIKRTYIEKERMFSTSKIATITPSGWKRLVKMCTYVL